MSSLSARLAEAAAEIMNNGGALKREEITAQMWERHPELLDESAKSLIDRAIWRAVKDLVRDDDEQQELPGLGFPRVIDIPTGDGTALKLARFATWDELTAARELRVTNIARASFRLHRFDLAMERVRPFMESHPEVRVCDVMTALGIEDEDDSTEPFPPTVEA